MGPQDRRLDDKIRQLCASAVDTKNPQKVKPILSELRSAIHQYTQRLRTRAAAGVTGGSEVTPERRNSKG
jgi:hypothetical protein